MVYFLRRQTKWEELYFYKKTDVLYQLTFAFTKRFQKVNDRGLCATVILNLFQDLTAS